MTNVKKTLSVLLAFVLVLGTCMFSAFAAGTDTATIKVVPDKTTANVGDVITVSVKLDASYAVASTSAIVKFDTADFELVAGPTMNDTLFGSKLATDAVAYEPQAGVVGAYFVAKKTAKYEAKKDVELFSFQLKALKDNAQAALTLPEAELKSEAKPDGKIYCGKGNAEDKIITVPCTIALTNATVAIGGGAPATPNTLVVKDTFYDAANVVIDKNAPTYWAMNEEATGLVYGIDTMGYVDVTETGDLYTLEDALTTRDGDQYLRITASSSDEYGDVFSTGSKIEVLDPATNMPVETYYFVYFGDADGNGVIDNTDGTEIYTYAADEMSVTDVYKLYALDADNNTFMDNSDGTALDTMVAADGGYPNQGAFARHFYDEFLPEYENPSV